ncbi:hypothetical protein HDU98_005272, partial [Podochytrium sp. JEL0797]
WPRIPTIVVGNPFPNPATSPFNTNGSLLTASPATPFLVQINLAVNVSVFSPNYATITVDDVGFLGQVLAPSTATPIPGLFVTGQSGRVSFAGRSETNFTMPLEILYNVTDPTATIISDAGLALFAMRCVGRGGTIEATYTVDIFLRALRWTGYNPSVGGKLGFECPNLVGALNGLRGLI